MNNYIVTLLDGKLVCQDLFNNKIMKEEATIKFLQMIDSSVNNKILLQGNKITIRNVNKGYSVDIKNFVQFYLSNYKDLINNTVDIIKKNESKIQKNKHANKKVKGSIIAKVGISVAPIVMVSMLATGLSKEKLNTNIENNKLNFEPTYFETMDQKIKDSVSEDVNTILSERYKIEESLANNREVAVLNVDDRSSKDEIIKIQSEYKDICEKVGKKWGVSPNVLLGLLTQESHGKEINLTQIEFDQWDGQILKVYNYDEKRWMKAVLTNEPEKFDNVDIKITKKDITNPYTVISTTGIILNFAANYLKTDNIFAILEYYNKGHGNFYKNMNALVADANKSLDDVLKSSTDTDLINYSNICKVGDPKYICNVMQYVPNKEDGGVYFYRIDNDQEKLIQVNVSKPLENNMEPLEDMMIVKNTR